MSEEHHEKITRNKLGLLKLAEMLGNVPEASLDKLQVDLDVWLTEYKRTRAHSGR